MNISLVALSAARFYSISPLISHPFHSSDHLLNLRDSHVQNLFANFFQSHSDRVKISIEKSHFDALLGSVVDVNSYFQCGRTVTDSVSFPQLGFLKIANCKFVNIESFEKNCFSFHTSTGITIIVNSLFSQCKSHGAGKVMSISTTQLRLDGVCIEDSTALDTHTSFEFDAHTYGRVIVESVSIKRAAPRNPGSLKMQIAVYGDYQRMNNYNNSESSDPKACMGLSTTYACNSDFTFCIFNSVESLSLILANNFKETDRFSYFNFVNCTCEARQGSLLTVYEGKSVDVNHWAFSDVSVDAVIISVHTKSVVVSNCKFWFGSAQENIYFRGENIATRNVEYGSRNSTLVPFRIPIDDGLCRCTKCADSLFLPSEEILNDVIVTMICAALVGIGLFTGVMVPHKDGVGEDRLL